MKHPRFLIGALAIMALSLFATPAFAATATISPAMGPAGTIVNISGGECLPTEEFPVHPRVGFLVRDDDGNEIHFDLNVDVDEEGMWSFSYEIPLVDTEYLEFLAFCSGGNGTDPAQLVDYDSLIFTYAEIGPPPTTEPEPTTTTTEAPPTTEQPTTTVEQPEPTTAPTVAPTVITNPEFTSPPGGGVQTDGGVPDEAAHEQNNALVFGIMAGFFALMLFLTRNKKAKKVNSTE